MTVQDRIDVARATKQKQDATDLAVALEKGMVPPVPGQAGVYTPPGKDPITFEVIAVEGMICKCLYLWQSHDDEPSCFIWGFLREGLHNKYHTWKGHPEWDV